MEKIIQDKIDYLIANGDFEQLKNYIQHSNYTTYEHSIAVASQSLYLVRKFNIKIDIDELITAALLHDYYLYDWHIKDRNHRFHGFFHGNKAMINALKHYNINKRQQNAISRHMFPLTLPPTNRLGIIITIADKMCATKEIFARRIILDWRIRWKRLLD